MAPRQWNRNNSLCDGRLLVSMATYNKLQDTLVPDMVRGEIWIQCRNRRRHNRGIEKESKAVLKNILFKEREDIPFCKCATLGNLKGT